MLFKQSKFFYSLVFLVSSFSLASCGRSDDFLNDDNNSPHILPPAVSHPEGFYEISSYTVDGIPSIVELGEKYIIEVNSHENFVATCQLFNSPGSTSKNAHFESGPYRNTGDREYVSKTNSIYVGPQRLRINGLSGLHTVMLTLTKVENPDIQEYYKLGCSIFH